MSLGLDDVGLLRRIYSLVVEFLYVSDGRGELEGGCRASICRYVYTRSFLARIMVERRPVLDAAALLAAYGLNPVLTKEQAVMMRKLVSSLLEAPEGPRSMSVFAAIATVPGLGVPAATLPFFLVNPAVYPLYDEEYSRGLRSLLHIAGVEKAAPSPEEIRDAAKARNQPLVTKLYRMVCEAHREAVRRYTLLTVLLGQVDQQSLGGPLQGLAVDALARLIARGRLSGEELAESLRIAGEVREIRRALLFAAGRLLR